MYNFNMVGQPGIEGMDRTQKERWQDMETGIHVL